MKKIVSAALVASMVAGAAFATDAKITLNFRTKLDAFSYRNVDDGTTEATVKEWLDWEGYDGAGAQSATKAADTFKFVLNGEKAGATLALNVNTSNTGSATTGTLKESGGGSTKDKAVTATNNIFVLNEYSAWMAWELGPGKLTLRSGNWKDGYADGAYRVKKDVDAQNAEGMDFERFKLGSILGKTRYEKSSKVTAGNANNIAFVDDLAKGANNSALFSAADYGFNVADGVNLNILLGSVYNKFDKVVDDDTTTYYDAFFVSRVQLKMDPLNAELIYKKPSTKSNVFALYVMPKVMDQLTLNVGGALEMGNDTGKSGEDFTDWAFDLRARYQATDELSITFFTNLSGTDLDAGRVVSAGVTGRKGAWGWEAVAQNFDSEETLTGAPVKTAMWNNLSARYKVNDLLTATLNVGLITALSKIDGDDTSYGPEWRVTPAVQIYAASNASIWAGVALSGCKVEDLSTFNVDVPVIFRVKM